MDDWIIIEPDLVREAVCLTVYRAQESAEVFSYIGGQIQQVLLPVIFIRS